MSGYRCVNYYELCRLCTTSNGSKVNIFSEENKRKNLSSKIIDVLPVLHLDEKDKLPKIICTQCLQNIESYADFRETSINAQNMLQSCLNSTKLCNGGQVYIKDATTVNKKSVSAPQTLTLTSPLKNEISLTPIGNNTATLMTPSSDFLSSIMQAVGIQQSEENDSQSKMAAQQLSSGQNTQFRITFDTNSVKNSNQVQYKIQQEQPTTSFIATAAPSVSHEQNQTALAQVNEFLKLKATPNAAPKRPEVTKSKPEPKLKKPKMQVLTTPVKTPPKPVQQLQTPPQQQQQIQIQKTFKGATIAMPLKAQVQAVPQQTSPMKSTPLQIQDIKFVSAANKCMVPLVLKNNDGTQQIFSQFAASSDSKPVAYLQMKIEPNADGQPCVQLTPTQMPATLQLTSQQLQQFGFQQFQPAQIQAQPSQNANTQQFQVFSPQTITTPVSMATTTTTLQTNTTASQTQTVDETDDIDDDCGDDALMEVGQMDTSDEVEEVKPRVDKPAPPTRKKISPMSPQQNTPTSSASTRSYSSLSQIPKHQSELATKQLEVISLHKDPTTPAKAMVVNENQEPVEEIFSLTKCQVCGKEFKKKEHCMQHLKTHIGLRPFVCQDKSGCNKSFNRKEHLLRHVVSHTGKKMFNCDLCHKFFSRKDNLNKHRRTHPEARAISNTPNLPYQCEMCERSFVAKSQYLKHKASHENQSSDDKDDDEPPPPTNVPKTPKNQKANKAVVLRKVKQEPIEPRTDEPQQPQEQQLQSQPPALQIIKQQQQPSQHTTNAQMPTQMHHPQIIQILPSMMSTSNAQTITINQQDQQPKTTIIKTMNADGNTTVYTIPSNLIINPAQFMTAGEMMGNFKIENGN